LLRKNASKTETGKDPIRRAAILSQWMCADEVAALAEALMENVDPVACVLFDYCVDLIFRRRVGGGYIFVHRLLMEHFAAMYQEDEK